MPYTAKLNGNGTYVVSLDGAVVVSHARAKRIAFSSVTTHTLEGTIHHIAGPCIVTVRIPGVGDVEAQVVG